LISLPILSLSLLMFGISLPACTDDGTDEAGSNETGETGDGDGDGTEVGDGDGDNTEVGDGDGDDPGDGDGDDPGDGDGDDPGDGDGDDPGDGDGDGDGDDPGDGDGDDPRELSFAADVYPIIADNCSCHQAGAGGLTLNPGGAYDNLVGVAAVQDPNLNLVEPGDPANSYFYQKLEGTQAGLSPGNAQMPKTQGSALSANPLSDTELATIADWITAGALP